MNAMKNEQAKIVYVIGHRNPDTDSVCSAIGYAHFKNLTDKGHLYIPARAGKINDETRFVLERFGVPVPEELDSMVSTVNDLNLKKPVSVNSRDSVQSLAQVMREKKVRAVPVVDDAGRLAGIVGLRDIAAHYMDSVGFADLTHAPVDLDMLVRTLDGRMLCNSLRLSSLTGRIFASVMQKGTILNRVRKGDVVIVGDQHDVQTDLIHAGCAALIVVDSMPVSAAVIAEARKSGTLILSSPHSAFATLQLITMSVPVGAIMGKERPTVGLYTPISELRKRILESEYRSEVVVDSDDRLIGFVTRSDLMNPVRKRAILVDHNEISQAVDGIEEAEILEIIDHHRVGDISTVAPIYVYNDPVGSTCTVVATLIFLHQMRIPSEIAGVLLSGILSDTLLLTLSTTTDRDRAAAERLAETAGISVKEYGRELLDASINIAHKTTPELIAADFKEFHIGGKKLGISQMMVLDCEMIDLRESELLQELERLRVANGYDLTALLVTNPLSSRQERVLLKGETWIVEKAFNVKVVDGTCKLPTILSRKKDFIPALGQALSMSVG
ncbi:MAG: putative manganese-dependent inorganic diphosphatase [Chloroflexota bacterium]